MMPPSFMFGRTGDGSLTLACPMLHGGITI